MYTRRTRRRTYNSGSFASPWINTMHRCALAASMAAVAVSVSIPTAAQTVQRPFPQSALRGVIAFGVMPEITLNGQNARLAPGARLHGLDNMLLTPAALAGKKAIVNYTVEINGLVQDVWLLTADEQANKPWPTTPLQAQTWSFDPVAQTWTKP